MYELELIMFLVFAIITYKFFGNWFKPILKSWPPGKMRLAKLILAILPLLSLVIIVYTLRVLASFDVVDDAFYILYYICFGYAWIHFGLIVMTLFFDISWLDDALHRNNNSALLAVCGGFLGMTMIYAGANIGDGPGWWCVLFAGGLGLITWILLGMAVGLAAKTAERITVDRDIYCGLRFGFYLYASGIILGRASAGDWGSFSATAREFLDGWPVLILTLLAIISELIILRREKAGHKQRDGQLLVSSICGFVYVLFACTSVYLLPPLTQHPYYGSVFRYFI